MTNKAKPITKDLEDEKIANNPTESKKYQDYDAKVKRNEEKMTNPKKQK